MNILLSLIIFSSLSSAATWRSGKIYYYTEYNSKKYYDISKNCNESCLANKARFKKNGIALTEDDLFGGKNPQSLLCSKVYQGTVKVLKDKKGNENSFCFFSDGSFISSTGLASED